MKLLFLHSLSYSFIPSFFCLYTVRWLKPFSRHRGSESEPIYDSVRKNKLKLNQHPVNCLFISAGGRIVLVFVSFLEI